MDNRNFFLKYSEQYINTLSIADMFALREKASKNGDILTLLDIATYRYLHGSTGIYMNLLPELFYLYGKTCRISELKILIEKYNMAFSLFGLPDSCMQKAKKMLEIGCVFPYLNEEELQYLEATWCDSNSFEWMDIIMYDSYRLPRQLKRFDKSKLNQVHDNFSDDFLIQVYECFESNEGNPNFLLCYDKKSNNIIVKKYDFLGKDEYVIENQKEYKDVNDYLTGKYGKKCADYFAKKLTMITMGSELNLISLFGGNKSQMVKEEQITDDKIEETKNICFSPMTIIEIAESYFDDKHEIVNLKKWFANDFLYRCNHPDKFDDIEMPHNRSSVSDYKILYFSAENCEWNAVQEIEFSKQSVVVPIDNIHVDKVEGVLKTYGVRDLPTMILVDGERTEIYRWIGVTSSRVINNYLFENGYVIKPTDYIDDSTTNYTKIIDGILKYYLDISNKSGQLSYKPQIKFSDDFRISLIQSQYKQYCLQTKAFYVSDNDRARKIKQTIRNYYDEPNNRFSKAMKYLYEETDINVLTLQIKTLAFYSIVRGCGNYEKLPEDVQKDMISPEVVSEIIGMYIYFVILANNKIDTYDFDKIFVETWVKYYENLSVMPLMFRMSGSKVNEDFKDVLVYSKVSEEDMPF